MAYRIKNWEKFQHYKDKKPGARLHWIKLYPTLLDDPEWNALSGDAAKFLLMLWMVASDTDGVVPDIKRLSFRMRLPEKKANDLLSKVSHWVYNDSRDRLEPVYTESIQDKIREDKRREDKIPGPEDRACDMLFDAFWEAYPKKTAKVTAKKSWNRLRPNEELFRKILKALEAQKTSTQWSKDDGTYVPYPSTWLNQRRWEDEIQKSNGAIPEWEIATIKKQ